MTTHDARSIARAAALKALEFKALDGAHPTPPEGILCPRCELIAERAAAAVLWPTACPTCHGPRDHLNDPCRSMTSPDAFHRGVA